MIEKNLEKRMYFFVPYNILDIQKGIQAGHCVEIYANDNNDDDYKDYLNNYKTWIILNGGTMNSNPINLGTMDITLKLIEEFNMDNEDEIKYSYFREPDLNDGLSSICFLLDERVFNRVDYPDFKTWLISIRKSEYNSIKLKSIEELTSYYKFDYKEWLTLIGGKKNEFLKDLIKDKKLA